jgi:hypothetical protein
VRVVGDIVCRVGAKVRLFVVLRCVPLVGNVYAVGGMVRPVGG